MWMSGTKKNREMHDACISFLESEVHDPAVREKLRPTTEFGCKRVLFLDDWYSMYNQANVELVTERPIRITEHGIISKSPDTISKNERARDPTGSYEKTTAEKINEVEVEREIDVLIWGTGFDMNDSGGHFQIYGINGANLSQTWKDYPKTYWCKFNLMFLTFIESSTLRFLAIVSCRRQWLSQSVSNTRTQFDQLLVKYYYCGGDANKLSLQDSSAHQKM